MTEPSLARRHPYLVLALISFGVFVVLLVLVVLVAGFFFIKNLLPSSSDELLADLLSLITEQEPDFSDDFTVWIALPA